MQSTLRLESLRAAGVIAVIRAPDPESARRGVEALVESGIRGIEITYSTPDAAAVIAALRMRWGSSVLLGAGTLVAPAQVREAAEAGADFLVSPGYVPEVAEAMVTTGRTVLLGALTPTEVMQATSRGAHAIKVFPASLGGPAYLGSLRGPFPELDLVPTGGVNADNLGRWMDAGALAVGAGSDLCSTADLAAGRWDDLRSRARGFVTALDEWRARS